MSYPCLLSRFVSFQTLSIDFQHKKDPSQVVGKVACIRLGYFFIDGPILLLRVNSLSEMALIVGEYILQGSGIPIIILQRMTSFQNIKTVNSEEGPCSRWGHAMVAVQNTIYLFGGYQNSKYYNDLWRFDLATLAFERVPQQGELPPPCSNFTLTYHQQQNVLLLFGGGTLNKEKLNTIYKLDLGTLSWSKVGFDESSPQPWQRSYHCAEMIGQYLVITGGEYFHDLDDTWLFDLHANQWREIKLSEDALKPKARKFASSFTHGNKLFVIGGCTGKYECVDDCFEMDFSEFLESGSMKALSWKKVQFSNKDLLVRWGHISVVKGNKAYIFGGRLNNKDLQNLIEIDIPSYSCSAIEFKGASPKGRRRPGLCIKNNTLFCFSGFDGSYVKDFIYFSLPSCIDSNKISEDLEGKKELMRLLAPQNVEQSCINFEDQVFYVAEEQFEEIEQYLCLNESKKTVNLFKKLDYHINADKITAKSAFFASFLCSAYQSESFELFCSEKASKEEKTIISKMLATYFQFGKVIVPQCEFSNSKKYFISLLDIADYYCCEDLAEICRKELMKFFTDEIVSPKGSIASIVGMCEVMVKINKQYENYAGYSLLKKLVEKNRGAINTMGDLRQLIHGEKELTHKNWMFKMAQDHSFELSQLIMRKKEACLQNINSGNVPHKEEILYEKTRKGSMHNRHANA